MRGGRQDHGGVGEMGRETQILVVILWYDGFGYLGVRGALEAGRHQHVVQQVEVGAAAQGVVMGMIRVHDGRVTTSLFQVAK